jgi:hypothetical protein
MMVKAIASTHDKIEEMKYQPVGLNASCVNSPLVFTIHSKTPCLPLTEPSSEILSEVMGLLEATPPIPFLGPRTALRYGSGLPPSPALLLVTKLL